MNIKKSEFNFDNEDLLNDFFESREELIYHNITQNKQELHKKEYEDYSKIYTAINNIPNNFKLTIEMIKESIENYINTLTNVQAKENEIFYKTGFSDAFKLFTECLYQNTDKEKEL